jgi:uncharacterized membrane protein
VKRVDDLNKLISRMDKMEKELADLKKEKQESNQFVKNENVVRNAFFGVETKKTPNIAFNWSSIEQVWLPRIFIFVLLLGIVWGFKVAVDGGFINEPVRVLLGFILSGVLVYFGEKNMKHSRNSLGQSLLGGSVVALMLTTFAMQNLYGMIEPFVAFSLNIIWIMGGIFLAYRHRSESLAVIAALGGYLVPFLIANQFDSTLLFASYAVVFYLSLLYFSLKLNFNILYFVSTGLLPLVFFVFLLISNTTIIDDKIFAISMLTQHLFLLLVLVLKKLQTKVQLPILFTSFTITIAWLSASFDNSMYVNFLIVFAIFYMIVTYIFWNKKDVFYTASLPVISSIAMFSFSLFLLNLFEWDIAIIVVLIQGTISVCLGFKSGSRFNLLTGSVLYSIAAYVIFFDGFSEVFSLDTLAWSLLLISLFFVYKFSKSYHKKLSSILFFSEAFLILVFITILSSVLTSDYGMNVQYLSVSFSWLLYSILGIIFGVTKGNKNVRIIGVILIVFTLLKIIFFDLPNVTLIVRAILFISLGGIGLLVSRIFYKKV